MTKARQHYTAREADRRCQSYPDETFNASTMICIPTSIDQELGKRPGWRAEDHGSHNGKWFHLSASGDPRAIQHGDRRSIDFAQLCDRVGWPWGSVTRRAGFLSAELAGIKLQADWSR